MRETWISQFLLWSSQPCQFHFLGRASGGVRSSPCTSLGVAFTNGCSRSCTKHLIGVGHGLLLAGAAHVFRSPNGAKYASLGQRPRTERFPAAAPTGRNNLASAPLQGLGGARARPRGVAPGFCIAPRWGCAEHDGRSHAGVQVDAAVESVRLVVEAHHGLAMASRVA